MSVMLFAGGCRSLRNPLRAAASHTGSYCGAEPSATTLPGADWRTHNYVTSVFAILGAELVKWRISFSVGLLETVD